MQKRSRISTLAATLFTAALAVTACGAKDDAAKDGPDKEAPMAPDTPPVSGQPWFGGPPAKLPLADTRWVQVGGPGRLRIDGAEYTATVGCNTIGGAVVVAGTSLTLAPGVSTRMYCAELAEAEAALQRDLGAVASFRLAGDRLELLDGSGKTLRTFAPEQDVPLAGAWQLLTLVEDGASGGTVSSSATDTEVSLTIGADGAVSGSDGCNRIMATSSTTGATPSGRSPLRFGPLSGTRMACEPEVMARAAAFTKALERTAGWSTEGTTLSLYDASGNLVAEFTRG